MIRLISICCAFFIGCPGAVAKEHSIDYLIFEGGGPDQGPGRDVAANMAELRARFGSVDPDATRMYGYGVQQLRILSRSIEVVARDVNRALDLAEETGVPVFLHVDPCYAWGADDEVDREDAPAIKFWKDPEMREWGEFPQGDVLPKHIPRFWFSWGPWCSPSAAVPAFGAPKFIELARSQLKGGVLEPLAARLNKWKDEDRTHLFAGINIGWETHLPAYPENWRELAAREGGTIVAKYPRSAKGLKMDPRIPGMQLGYASLHWRGWNEARLVAAARKEGIKRDEKFRRLCYRVIHDTLSALSKECHDHKIPANRVYTHIVALATVKPADTNHPPIWTAVNPYSTPGFTMDNKGAARFDLMKLVQAVEDAPGSRKAGFGVVESYVSLSGRRYVDKPEDFRRELVQLFDAGATIKVIYGAFPFGQRLTPEAALKGAASWLEGGQSEMPE
ncbi:hypothetical protein V2O64_10165 [Verrucomicrobiaceae bacterium 227]